MKKTILFYKKLILIIILLIIIKINLFSDNIEVKIKSVLSTNKININGIITNTVTFLCRNISDIQKIIIDYPKDPRIYGLDIVDVIYREKLSFNTTGKIDKIIKLDYFFKPKFIGVIAVDPIKINLVTLNDSKTNTYSTKKIELIIHEEKNNYIWVYIIVLSIIILICVIIVLNYEKIKNLVKNKK